MKFKLFAFFKRNFVKTYKNFKKLFVKKRKYYNCDKEAFAKLNMSYYDDFNDLADNAFAMRNKYRKKIEKIIYKRYIRDYKRLAKLEKNARVKL